MGQREDVERSLRREEGRDGREVYAARTVRREGWRARLAHVENILASSEPLSSVGPLRERVREALAEIRSMLDEMPQIGTSQRAPLEIPPVRESER